MLHTADRMSRATCAVTVTLLFLAAFHPTISYTTQHHGHRLGVRDGANNPMQSLRNHYSKSLHMSTPSDNNDKDLNYYEILGASQDASRGELKKKYIALARVSHPDAAIGGSNSQDEDVDFQNVAEAWRTLGNPKSRRRYDRQLKAKAWGDAAQKLTNERLEQVAPLASTFMDNLAVPFLRKTSATVGKAIKTGVKVAEAMSSSEEESTKSYQDGTVEQTTEISMEQNITTGTTTINDTVEFEAPTEAVQSIVEIAANNQIEPNGASTTTTPIAEQPTNVTTSSSSIAEENLVAETTIEEYGDDDMPDELLDEKSQELQEQLESITQEYDSVKAKRLFASLQSPEYTLTSTEAEEVLEKLNANDTVSFVNRASKQTHIKKDILSLRNTEQQFTEKLESYTEIDRDWNFWLTKQESAKKALRENKQKEFEARRALTTAEEMVSQANTDVMKVSNKLIRVEQEVRKSAQEMDRVSMTLTRKQEKVQNALRRKTELMKGGISVEYVNPEEITLLRQQESQLLGESKQIATMVAKLQSRADELQKRAEKLEQLKKN